MAQRALEHRGEKRVENLERRVTAVEQILPTLATRVDLLATKTDLEAAIAPLATKAEVKAEAAETRRHFDVAAESLGADIRMIAEGVVALQSRLDAHYADIKGVLVEHDRRLMRLESSRPRRQ